jgi:hypothetical protein
LAFEGGGGGGRKDGRRDVLILVPNPAASGSLGGASKYTLDRTGGNTSIAVYQTVYIISMGAICTGKCATLSGKNGNCTGGFY